MIHRASLPERLRGQTRNLLGSACAGSSPAGCAFLLGCSLPLRLSLTPADSHHGPRQRPCGWPCCACGSSLCVKDLCRQAVCAKAKSTSNASRVGFEPTRDDPIGFQVRRLIHCATATSHNGVITWKYNNNLMNNKFFGTFGPFLDISGSLRDPQSSISIYYNYISRSYII